MNIHKFLIIESIMQNKDSSSGQKEAPNWRDLQLIGTISEIQGPVINVKCDYLPPLHQALIVRTDNQTLHLEVFQHIDNSEVKTIVLGRPTDLKRHMQVYDSGGPLRTPVNEKCLGRVLDILGKSYRWKTSS